MIREERVPLEQLAAEDLESLYARIDALTNQPALRHCLVPGCLREFDVISCMAGDPPPRPSWSGKGWSQLGGGTIFPAGGHICPDHQGLVTAHLPGRLQLPDGHWGANCACGWTAAPHRWHGVVRALWEEHILTVSGALKEPTE